MFCRKCGTQLNEGAMFCPKCGQRVGNGTDSAPVTDSNSVTSDAAKTVEKPATVSSGTTGKSKEKKGLPKGLKIALISVAAVVVLFIIIGIAGSGGNTGTAPAASDYNDSQPKAENSNDEKSSQEKDESSKTTETSNPESIEKLLTVINNSEEIMQQFVTEYQSKFESDMDYAEKWKDLKEINDKYIPEIEELDKQASQIQGLDPKVRNAAEQYFEMKISGMNNLRRTGDFLSQFFELDMDPPQSTSYNSVPDYYEALYSWYEGTKEKIDAVTVSPDMEDEWNSYKDAFELNYNIVEKEYLAVQYNDFLRHYSATNLVHRQSMLDEKEFGELVSRMKAGQKLCKQQFSIATKLSDEITSYSEMDEKSRSDYEFEYNRENKIRLDYDAIETIYPSLYNTYDSFLIINTGCISGTRRIVVEAEIPGFSMPYKESFNLDSSYKKISILPPPLSGDLDLSTAKKAQMNVSIYEKDGNELIESKSFPITIKSIDDFEWYSDDFGIATQDNILCYLTPDAEEIDLLKRNAITEISNITAGKIESMVGYQENGYNHYVGTYIQAAGIMRALYDMGIRYDMAPFSMSDSDQRIKLPKEVIEKESGLCIETSLTVASALQSAGMHAFLLLPTGHAQVAVEVWDNGDEGTGEYFLIETTCLDSDSNSDEIFREYANALMDENPDDLATNYPIAYYSASEWAEYIKANDVYVIDCDDSRILGLTEFAN